MTDGQLSIYVAGTAAGVGKTTFAAGLLRRLRALGLRAAGIKPVETGCGYGKDHDLIAADGRRLHAAAQLPVPLQVCSPYRVVPALDPAAALELAGLEIALEDLAGSVRALFRYADIAVVEGTGGALAPVASDALGLDLAEEIGAALVVVAPDVPGSASQVLLVLEAARRRALPIAGVVLTPCAAPDARPGDEPGKGATPESSTARLIRQRGGVRVLPRLPHLEGREEEAAVTMLEAHLAGTGVAEAILDAARAP